MSRTYTRRPMKNAIL